jgi:hypothetical protein
MITVETVAERYRVHVEAANRSLASNPTQRMHDYRHAMLHGAWVLAFELGASEKQLGESPNAWAERTKKMVRTP